MAISALILLSLMLYPEGLELLCQAGSSALSLKNQHTNHSSMNNNHNYNNNYGNDSSSDHGNANDNNDSTNTPELGIVL